MYGFEGGGGFFVWGWGVKAYYYVGKKGDYEGWEEFVDSEGSSEFCDYVFPDEYESSACYHASYGALQIRSFPKERKKYNGAKGCSKTCPGK